MTHTSDLDHALAEALSQASEPYADEVDFGASELNDDETPREYSVVAWRDGTAYAALAATAIEGLRAAMAAIAAAAGSAS